MFDKNTLRAMHKAMFMRAICQRREQQQQQQQQQLTPFAELLADEPPAANNNNQNSAILRAYVRKRPISEKEEQIRGDYDALTVVPGRPCATDVILHNCAFQADLITPFILHSTFRFDSCFGEEVTNQEVYETSAKPLVQTALSGGMSTMFMFGQTGSGKTHTMTAMEQLAAQDLFAGAPDGSSAAGGTTEEPWVTVQFIELRGNRCFDLLPSAALPGRAASSAAPPPPPRKGAPKPQAPPELRLRELRDGSYVADAALSLAPGTPEELCTLLRRAHACRATSSTDANDTSSRSHAVCTLRLGRSRGQLLLVDCAGTERRKDSMYHSKERQQEGAEINASLHALKECFRYLTTQHNVPSHVFRGSALTKILAESFFPRGKEVRMAVVCTASPCASDTEHTLSTLRTGMSLCTKGLESEEKQLLLDAMEKKQRVLHPKTWTPEMVRTWFDDVSGGDFRDIVLPSNFTGQMLVRVTETRCVQLCRDEQRRGRTLFHLLHAEMQRAG
ncbi:unnamed protein product [Polarella glacialis]|uniref:Kinesin motor domain-containing protein n=1 Tax=Polarella glacialis TaxID=89957 RepID=A0A813J2E2_POLGL|nr:unnamed protein product [Polarella glacialis]